MEERVVLDNAFKLKNPTNPFEGARRINDLAMSSIVAVRSICYVGDANLYLQVKTDDNDVFRVLIKDNKRLFAKGVLPKPSTLPAPSVKEERTRGTLVVIAGEWVPAAPLP